MLLTSPFNVHRVVLISPVNVYRVAFGRGRTEATMQVTLAYTAGSHMASGFALNGIAE